MEPRPTIDPECSPTKSPMEGEGNFPIDPRLVKNGYGEEEDEGDSGSEVDVFPGLTAPVEEENVILDGEPGERASGTESSDLNWR